MVQLDALVSSKLAVNEALERRIDKLSTERQMLMNDNQELENKGNAVSILLLLD